MGYKVESGVINQDEALDDPERSIVSNMLGDRSIRIEVATKNELKRGHTVIVGTDGLFDNISHENIAQIVGTSNFEDSFQKLCDFCQEKNEKSWKKDDDIGFVLLKKVQA